jgi:adenylosuccinate lyase
MAGVIEGLGADRERLLKNLRGDAPGGGIPGGILAEPAYILLAESGVSDAHEVIRKITLKAEKENLSFAAALSADPGVRVRLGKKMAELGLVTNAADALSWFEKPEQYNGLAVKKAKTLAAKYRKLMEE